MSLIWDWLVRTIMNSFERFWDFLVKHDKWVYVGLGLLLILPMLINK